MKRVTRIVTGALVLALMCFGLCSCQILDEMRGAAGQIQADGSVKMVDGTKYLPLDLPEGVTPLDSEMLTEFIMVAGAEYEDLPLLLHPFYGLDNNYYRDKDGILMQDLYAMDYSPLLCLEDHVQEYEDRLGDMSAYTAYYSMPDTLYEPLFMTEEQQNALNTVLQGNAVLAENFDYDSLLMLGKATADHVFGMDADLAIGCLKDTYYVYDYGRGDNQVYQIPVSPAELPAIQTYYQNYQDEVEAYYNSDDWY